MKGLKITYSSLLIFCLFFLLSFYYVIHLQFINIGSKHFNRVCCVVDAILVFVCVCLAYVGLIHLFVNGLSVEDIFDWLTFKVFRYHLVSVFYTIFVELFESIIEQIVSEL